ncbi:MAG: L,D-transpeptidase [Chloroflexota bacterium]
MAPVRMTCWGALLGVAISLAWVNAALARRPQPAAADYLCPTMTQLRHPERCPDQGPGARVNDLAILGLYPALPLPTIPVDPNLTFLPFDYLRVGENGADLFPSAQDAAEGSGATRSVDPGLVFLSYTDAIEGGGGKVYATQNGYVRGDSASPVTPASFRGLAFGRTPERSFGWIISGGTCSERTPGGAQDYTGRCYMKYEVIQIYDVQHVDERDWFLIGPDEWVEQRMVAKVDPDPTPPPGIDVDRWITVNLYEQTVAAYDHGELVYATVASTGRVNNWTQPGLFQVWAKLQRDNMTGGVVGENYYYLENVPWVLYFDQARALHGTYWHNRFGTPTSRGCANLSVADAHWFYNFAEEGTWVYVWDPSGRTPTDPGLYDAGGA